MSIKPTVKEVEGVIVVDVAGRLTSGDDGSRSLYDLIADLVKKDHKKVILNLANTTYVDSAGLNVLLSGRELMSASSARLGLLAIRRREKNLLQSTKNYSRFEIYETEADAIRAFNQ